jgi:hypothetical protein
MLVGMEPESKTSPAEASPSATRRGPLAEPDFNRPVRLIADLLIEPEFPKSALGEFVDIGGYTGVVVDVVSQSLKVRSPEGVTKSFNAGGLRKLYGPRVLPEPIPMTIPPPPPPPTPTPRPRAAEPPPPPPPKREVIIQPDFSKPVRKIAEFVGRSDYPKCVYGEHVEIAGFIGVVVEIVNRSLKVRSPAETTRSYNTDALRRLYGA